MSAKSTYSEAELLASIVRGDEEAFSHLYRQTNMGVYNAVMTYVRDQHAAREIVQQVYIKIWDRRGKLGEVRSVRDYLFILARNAVLDHIRKYAVEKKYLARLRGHVPVVDNNVITSIQERECGALLRQVISRLPSQQREAYLLASEDDMSYDKIAAHMQVSRFTVKRHLELARRFVRKNMHDYLHQEALVPFLVFFSTMLY